MLTKKNANKKMLTKKMLTKNVNKKNVNTKMLTQMMHWFHGQQTANPYTSSLFSF